MHRVGQVVQPAGAFGDRTRVLFGVERVPGGPLEQCLVELCGKRRLIEGRSHDSRSLGVAQRAERDGQCVWLAAAPPGAALEELGPSGADDEQRHVDEPVCELVDEVHQVVVGPVHVFEDEHRRT